MSSDLFKSLIQTFGTSIGLTSLSPDEDDYCCLGIDDKLLLHIKFDPRQEDVVFFTEVGRIDEVKHQELYALLLKWNNIIDETHGCTLAKLKDDMTVSLCYKEPIKFLEQQHFEAIMKTFLETAEKCVKNIADFTQGILSTSDQKSAT